MQQRPVSATVFGVLNIIFAVLGSCGLVFAMVQMFNTDFARGNPVIQIMQENPLFFLFYKVQLGGGILFTIILVVAGIGLLMLKSWGRRLSIWYGIYQILSAIFGMILNVLFVVQPLMDQAERMPPGPQRSVLMGGAIGGLIGGALGLIYPILLLFFMFRPNVTAAFSGQPEDDEGGLEAQEVK